MAEKLKLSYKKTILIGFGFMATSVVWGIYDPYITKILDAMLSKSELIASWSSALIEKFPVLLDFMRSQGSSVELAGGGFTLVPLFIGLIMTFDNVFGVIFQPAFGKLSDRTHSRYGKRSPFIYIFAPVSAILFALIPWMFLGLNSIPALMICVILFVFVMSLWRAPVVALMPDLTPPELRSEGNAIINLCGGVGSLIGMLAGTVIMAILGLSAADEQKSYPYVFLLASLVVIICTLVLFFKVKEPDNRLKSQADRNMALDEESRRKAQKEEEKAERERLKKIKLSSAERISLVLMLAGLFFLFCGTNSISTFFALFAAEIVDKTTAQATMLMAIFAVSSMLAAIPAGKLGQKFGRKKTIISGLAVFLGAFLMFMGIFTASNGMISVFKYASVKNTYSELSSEMNKINDQIKKQLDFDESDLLTMDDYVQYMLYTEGLDNTLDEEKIGYCVNMNSAIVSNGFNFDRLAVYNNEILKNEEGASAAVALKNVHEFIKNGTQLLSVLVFPVLILGGAANMFITVNTLPLVLEIGGVEKVGTFTGYYYTATFSAQIAAPIIFGIVRMFSGTYMSLFIFCPIAFVLSALCIFMVRHGEAAGKSLKLSKA